MIGYKRNNERSDEDEGAGQAPNEVRAAIEDSAWSSVVVAGCGCGPWGRFASSIKPRQVQGGGQDRTGQGQFADGRAGELVSVDTGRWQ